MQPPHRPIGLGGSDAGADEPLDPAEAIRERQRRRRDSSRSAADIQALLAVPDEEEEESTPAAALPKVWLVFHGTQWSDPAGSLRESDTIVGVYATEEGARQRVADLNTHTAATAGEGDAWYQAYSVES